MHPSQLRLVPSKLPVTVTITAASSKMEFLTSWTVFFFSLPFPLPHSHFRGEVFRPPPTGISCPHLSASTGALNLSPAAAFPA